MTLISQLSTLESAGLIRLAQFEPDLEYLFRHNLVQDAAYATLLPSDRRWLHRVVGEALEHLYPDRLNEYAAVLARHFRQAGDEWHALEYFSRAGDAALAAYANQEAESQYRSALALSCHERERAHLFSGLGEALYRQSRFAEALEAWCEGISLYQSLKQKEGMARLYARSARAAWHAGDHPEGLRLCQEGLEAVAGMAESPDLAVLVHEAGRAYYFNGSPDKARELCQQALAMAERLGAVSVEADTLATLGILPDQPAEEVLSSLARAVELAESAGLLEIGVRAYHNLGAMTKEHGGDLRAAGEHFFKAAELARQRGSAQEELLSLGSAADVSLHRGELIAAEETLSRMEQLVQTIRDPESLCHGLWGIQATLLERQGEWAQALTMWRDFYQTTRERGDLQGVLGATISLAYARLEMDRLGVSGPGEARASGLAEAERMLIEAMETGERGIGAGAWPYCLLSTLHACQAHFEEARRVLDEARTRTSAKSPQWDALWVTTAEARLAAAEQRWAEAMAAFETAAGSTARLGLRWLWAILLQDWAEAHVGRGEPTDLERAQALLREARAAFHEMNSPYYAGLVDSRLQSLRAKAYAQVVALGKAAQELAVAGRIQAGLLPTQSPYLPGWQLAATLEPARETSGDFYDFIPLPDGHLGLVIADVSDKGAGAALYMALTRTLLRTYASQFPAQPERALAAANQRILEETHTGMFVTVFYGILDADSGTLTYCNAGHNPPYLLNAEGIRPLERTGPLLGVLEDATWAQGTAQLTPGDAVVLYTDGVIDARTAEGVIFGQEQLLDVLDACHGCEAQEMEAAVLAAVHRFVGDAPRFDDLTLLIVARTR